MTEEDYMPEFVEQPMFDQLASILDSEHLPKPRNWVKTDDGDIIRNVTPKVAHAIRCAMVKTPTIKKLGVMRLIQSTSGFKAAAAACSR